MTGRWRELAACRDVEPELFHTAATAEYVIAAYCARCPVVQECLDDALRFNDTGVRGGRLLTHEHGTRAGYARHLYHGETPCAACQEGSAAYERDRQERHHQGRMAAAS